MTIRLVCTSAISAIVLVAARHALGCGSSPAPYWTIASTLPAEGGVIPPDGALIVRAAPSPPASGGTAPISLVVTEEGSADSIAGRSEVWSFNPPSVAWNALVALKPSTHYQAIVSLQEQTAPTGPAGPTGIIWELSTTADPVAPLTIEGSLAVVLEDYQRDIQECDMSECGPYNCRVTGHEPAVRAKISLPIVRGGYSADGYRGWLHYTANSPQIYDGPGEGQPPADSVVHLSQTLTLHEAESQEVEVPLIEEADPYEPCFALNVWDPTGHAIHAEAKCIGAFKPADGMKGVDSGCHCTMSTSAPHGFAAIMSYLGLTALGVARRRMRANCHAKSARRRPLKSR